MQVKAVAMIATQYGKQRMNQKKSQRQVAETVRAACLKAAQEAYENAGISGLCEAGRWECAVAAIQSLDLEAVINMPSDNSGK